jgi:hypothetical protein
MVPLNQWIMSRNLMHLILGMSGIDDGSHKSTYGLSYDHTSHETTSCPQTRGYAAIGLLPREIAEEFEKPHRKVIADIVPKWRARKTRRSGAPGNNQQFQWHGF